MENREGFSWGYPSRVSSVVGSMLNVTRTPNPTSAATPIGAYLEVIGWSE